MSAINDHAQTATDQLAVAAELSESREGEFALALAGAQVHALLAVAEAVRQAGLDAVVVPPGMWASRPRAG